MILPLALFLILGHCQDRCSDEQRTCLRGCNAGSHCEQHCSERAAGCTKACMPRPPAGHKDDPNEKFLCGGTKSKPKYCSKAEMKRLADQFVKHANDPPPKWQHRKQNSDSE